MIEQKEVSYADLDSVRNGLAKLVKDAQAAGWKSIKGWTQVSEKRWVKGATQKDNADNDKAVYDSLRRNGTMKMTDITTDTGLGERDVHWALQRLKLSGVVKEQNVGGYLQYTHQ